MKTLCISQHLIFLKSTGHCFCRVYQFGFVWWFLIIIIRYYWQETTEVMLSPSQFITLRGTWCLSVPFDYLVKVVPVRFHHYKLISLFVFNKQWKLNSLFLIKLSPLVLAFIGYDSWRGSIVPIVAKWRFFIFYSF